MTLARRALVVDDLVPRAAWGAGYPRSAQIIHALARCSDEVKFCPMREISLPPAASETFAAHVGPVAGHGTAALYATLEAGAGQPGLLWVGRPDNLAEVFRMFRMRPALSSGLRIVYDAEAVFASRIIAGSP